MQGEPFRFQVQTHIISVRCVITDGERLPQYVSSICIMRTFQQPNPVCCNRSTANLFMISFLSRAIDLIFFFLSLWTFLWLAETSQQPISQTTWLKVTPHCNYYNHYMYQDSSLTEEDVLITNSNSGCRLFISFRSDALEAYIAM